MTHTIRIADLPVQEKSQMLTLREIFDSLSATNFIDIGLIALLVYCLVFWFKGTRSLQIIGSIIGIGVFYFIATKLGLILTSVLFQYLWAAIIVVLVIVFQPEIRQMLDRASPFRHLMSSKVNDVKKSLIDEVVNAVVELAREKTGALIVFQRDDRLDNLALKGKDLDCIISAELVEALFQKDSPLHDGAILIDKGRIVAAGCILPLSRDEDLSRRYGTRHRAAIGITERSDAVSIVVSEERGEVSLVCAGQIISFKKRTEFVAALEKLLTNGQMVEDSDSSDGFFSLIASNWRLKLLSLITSIFLWFVIVGPQKSELGISVPIQYTNLPLAVEIIGQWMDRLDVRVRGSASSLDNLSPGSVRAVVDLSKVLPGLNFFRISSDKILVPPGITIAQIRPSDLQLNIETALLKQVKVVPTIVGALPEKSKLVVQPSEVKVRASHGDLKKLTSVTTDPVGISELINKESIKAPVIVKPEGLRIESIDPVQVTVKLEAEKN